MSRTPIIYICLWVRPQYFFFVYKFTPNDYELDPNDYKLDPNDYEWDPNDYELDPNDYELDPIDRLSQALLTFKSTFKLITLCLWQFQMSIQITFSSAFPGNNLDTNSRQTAVVVKFTQTVEWREAVSVSTTTLASTLTTHLAFIAQWKLGVS